MYISNAEHSPVTQIALLALAVALCTASTYKLQQHIIFPDLLTSVGRSVSLHGGRLLVGSQGQANVGGSQNGVARFYVLDRSSWLFEQEVTAPAELDDLAAFGSRTALTTNAAFVSAPYAQDSSGIVCMYTHESIGWVLRQRMTGEAELHFLGWAIAASGGTVLIGAFKPGGVGYVQVYRAGEPSWSLEQVLVPLPSVAENYFGFSVAVHGNMAVVGAHNTNTAYVYRRTNTQWQQASILEGPLDSAFGIAVGISATTVMVGATTVDEAAENAGAVYVYDIGTEYSLSQQLLPSDVSGVHFQFGRNLVLQGGTAVIATAVASSPYVLTHNGSAWQQVQRVPLLDGDSVVSTAYGVIVDMDDDRLVVGTFQTVSLWQRPPTPTPTTTVATTTTTTTSTAMHSTTQTSEATTIAATMPFSTTRSKTPTTAIATTAATSPATRSTTQATTNETTTTTGTHLTTRTTATVTRAVPGLSVAIGVGAAVLLLVALVVVGAMLLCRRRRARHSRAGRAGGAHQQRQRSRAVSRHTSSKRLSARSVSRHASSAMLSTPQYGMLPARQSPEKEHIYDSTSAPFVARAAMNHYDDISSPLRETTYDRVDMNSTFRLGGQGDYEHATSALSQ